MSIARFLTGLLFGGQVKVAPSQKSEIASQTKIHFTHEKGCAPNVTKLTDEIEKVSIEDVCGEYPDEISGREWFRSVSIKIPEGKFSRVERSQGLLTKVTAAGKFEDKDQSADFEMDITNKAYGIGCRETLFGMLKPKIGDKTDLVVASLCSSYPYELVEHVARMNPQQ